MASSNTDAFGEISIQAYILFSFSVGTVISFDPFINQLFTSFFINVLLAL